MIKSNRLPAAYDILVGRGDLALPTGAMVTATTALNLADGQLGVLSFDPNSTVRVLGNYNVTGDDSAEVQAIKVVAGTPKSNATNTVSLWEDGDLAKQESNIIRRGQIHSVSVKKATFGKLSAQVISNFGTPANDTAYKAYLTLDGVNTEKTYGANNDVLVADLSAINFTTSGITQPKDYVLQQFAFQWNSQSRLCLRNGFSNKGKKDFVVFGVNIAGSTGQVIGTVTPTTSIAFDTRNGINQVMTLGEAGVSALAELVHLDANLTATSTIERIDVLTAGAAAKVDALIVIGLERELVSTFDDQPQRITTVSVNLSDSFRLTATKPVTTTVRGEEQVNTGRLWLNEWRTRAGLMVHTRQDRPMGDWFNEGKTYINETKRYTSYVIDYFDKEATLTGDQGAQKRLVILLPCEKLAAFVVNVNNVITRIAAGNTPITMVTSNDAGTGTASVNTVAGLEAVLSAWLEHSRTTAGSFKVTGDAIAGGVYLS